MKRSISIFFMASFLSLSVYAFDKGQELNAPPPAPAQELVKRAMEAADGDRAEEGAALLKKAIAAAPDYLRAHVEYVRVKTYYLGRYDEVRAEYDGLIAKEPDNPVYLMALAVGQSATPPKAKLRWFEKVAERAPEWAWGHYAKAQLLLEKDAGAAVAELAGCIEKDPTAVEAYTQMLSLQERRLKKIDDAIATAEKMTAQPRTRTRGQADLWRLKLGKSGGDEAAKKKLKEELARLAASSRDVVMLAAIHSTYSDTLEDKESARAVETKIREIDSTWYPQRGLTTMFITINGSGIARQVAISGREMAILDKAFAEGESTPQQNIKRLEAALALNPGEALKRFLHMQIFSAAEKAGDTATLLKYGEALGRMDPEDSAIFARMALGLADQKKDLDKALKYAQLADEATAEFTPVARPANNDAEWFKETITDDFQKKNYQRRRALALEAHGLALSRMNKNQEAEAKLRKAVELGRSEKRLERLAEVLSLLGRTEEAEKMGAEAKAEFSESVKRLFVNEPSKDFELATVDGRKVKLSDLKGKAVMLDFWATWCGPCIREMPHLVEAYEKYKAQGFEILAISCDDKADRHKVAPFAKEHKLTFPILYDEGVSMLYGIQGYPTTIFIDRKGNVRFRGMGFGDETPRQLQVVIGELLK